MTNTDQRKILRQSIILPVAMRSMEKSVVARPAATKASRMTEHHLNAPIDLLKAIRRGRLNAVKAALDSGASDELNDARGEPGLPLGIACFLGFADIVRELINRGAKVNASDNASATSPLSMALRGKRKTVVELLIELGAEIPPGTQTGLSERELLLARWRAQHHAVKSATAANKANLPEFEDIVMPRCFGTDTAVLEAEVIRAARNMEKKA